MESKQPQDAGTNFTKHGGTWSYHEDDCMCMMGGYGYCNRAGYVWSCCGATLEISSCAGKGRQHHSAVSSRGDKACGCVNCIDKIKKI